MTDRLDRWQRRYERERAARLQAEAIAEAAIADLYDANQELDQRVAERTKQLEDALRAAEAARRAESTFLHGLAHELSTPLHAILGLVELVGELTDEPEIRASALQIEKASDRLHNALRTLVEFAAASGTEVKVNPAPTTLGRLADALAQRWQRRAARKGMLFVVEVHPDPESRFVSDSDRLAQVLDPLIDNAIRYGHVGRVIVEAQLTAAAQQPELRVTVSDEGATPISDELRGQIFEPFVRGPDSVGGFGMGLALSRAVAVALGGSVNLLPSQIGSVFEAVVPVAVE